MLIHQALHGYNQGHNRLACSIPLSSQDDDRMKIISDWSEYTDNEENSYLTAYPLPDADSIVVAKSWYADEMDRPGCVWTHSLIINLSSIDDKFDFRCLLSYFRRPTVGEYEYYSSPQEINFPSGEKFAIEDSDDKLVVLYLSLLNGGNGASIFLSEEGQSYYQRLCLTLLQYIPLDFLKTVGFCTGTAFGRKISNDLLSLQFATGTGVKLSEFVLRHQEQLSSVCAGLRNICSSMRTTASDTDQALRVFSSDIKADINNLCAVGLLLSILDDVLIHKVSKVSFSEILYIISDAFPSKDLGIAVKRTFCGKRVSSLFSDEVSVLSQLVSSVSSDFIDYTLIDYRSRVKSLLTEGGIQQYTAYLKQLVDSGTINNEGQAQMHEATICLDYNNLYHIAQTDFSVYMGLVMSNPSILRYGFWVDFSEQQFYPTYSVFVNHTIGNFDSWEKLFLVSLYRNYQINANLMNKFSQNVKTIVSDVMEYLESSVNGYIQPEVKNYCRRHASDILEWIRNREKVSMSVVRFVVDIIDVKQVQIASYSPDDFRCLYNTPNIADPDYNIFLLVLAFRLKDKGCVPYVRKSFKTVHDLLSSSRLPEYLWEIIEPYTEKLFFLQEWDRCKKLRKGLIRYLKSLGANLDVISKLTEDNNLNLQLVKTWEDL